MKVAMLKQKLSGKIPENHLPQINRLTKRVDVPLRRGKYGYKKLIPVNDPRDLEAARRMGQEILVDPQGNVFRASGGNNLFADMMGAITGADDPITRAVLGGKKSVNATPNTVHSAGNIWG